MKESGRELRGQVKELRHVNGTQLERIESLARAHEKLKAELEALDHAHGELVKAAGLVKDSYESQCARLICRVEILEKVPSWLRWPFRAQ